MHQILLGPDAGDGGGDQGGDDNQRALDNSGKGDGDDGDDGKGGDDKGKGGDDGKDGKIGLTKDDITDILSRVIPAVDDKRGEPEKKYTPDEIEKLLNVWKPDTSFLKKLGFENPTAEQLNAIHELRDNLVKQANTMSEARIQQLLAEKLAVVEELQGYVSEQRAAANERAFYEKHEELKPYAEVVDAVSRKLEEQGFKASSQEKVFEEIAKNSLEVLKRMNVRVEKPKDGGGRPSGNRMAQLSGGGQGGGAGDGKGGGKRKEGMAIFDETED